MPLINVKDTEDRLCPKNNVKTTINKTVTMEISTPQVSMLEPPFGLLTLILLNINTN